MKLKTLFITFIVFIIFITSVTASDYQSDENMNFLGNDIYNATNINSTYFYQNGTLVLDSVGGTYIYKSGTSAILNETKFNITSQANPKNWTKLQNYPAACPAGSYITLLNDSVTCTAALKTTGDAGAGAYNFTSMRINNTLRIGNSSSALLDAPANSYLRLGGIGSPTWATGDNDVFVSDRFEAGGDSLFTKATFSVTSGGDAMVIQAGSAYSYFVPYADDGTHIGLRSSVASQNNNNLIITNSGNKAKDHDHDTVSSDPTLFINSQTDPDDDNTEWLSLTYKNATDRAEIEVGKGYFAFLNNVNLTDNNLSGVSDLWITNLHGGSDINLEDNLDGTGFNITAEHVVANLTGTADTATTWDGETSQANLNVNSSNYWDSLGSPSDINAADITDDDTYALVAGEVFTGNVGMSENNITNVTNYQYLSNPGLTGNYSINATACWMSFGGGILYATNCTTI